MAFQSYEKRTPAVKTIIKDTRRLYNKIMSRIRNIEKRFPNSHVSSSLKQRIGGYYNNFNLREMSNKDIRALHKELELFDTKEYSRVSGYKQYYRDVEQKLENLSDIDRERAWEMFDRFKEEIYIDQQIKYKIVGQIAEYKQDGLDDEEIRDRIEQLSMTYEESQGKSFEDIVKDYEDLEDFYYYDL